MMRSTMLSYSLAMARTPIYEWQAMEYPARSRGSDWYWALGILAIAACIVCILFNDILLGLVILAGSSAIALQAFRPHREHTFTITEEGVSIDSALYLYSSMRDFSVLEYLDTELPPALSIYTNHILAPHLLIPIVGHDPFEIYEYVLNHIPEGDHEHSVMDRIMHVLHF